MAQAQVDMDLEGRIEKGDTKRSFLHRRKRSANVNRQFSKLIAPCHTMPLVVKIQSTPLEDVLNTQVLLEDNWTVYVGGSEGESFLRTHLNIRKRGEDGSVVRGEGVSVPLPMIDCLQEALETIKDGYKLLNTPTANIK